MRLKNNANDFILRLTLNKLPRRYESASVRPQVVGIAASRGRRRRRRRGVTSCEMGRAARRSACAVVVETGECMVGMSRCYQCM